VKTIVERGGERLTTPVENVIEGDRLLELFAFPDSLKKLTIVNVRLVQELKKRGFAHFRVQKRPKTPNARTIKHQQTVRKVSELVEKVKANEKVRGEATGAVEDMMDSTRMGKANITDVKRYVESIVSDGGSEAISVIASLKQSDQTYAHCVDVGAIFQVVYKLHCDRQGKELTAAEEQQITLGAFMHDVGKARIPKEILDSTVRFERDSREMQLMQAHPVFGAEILGDMGVPETIVNMAHYHHVKLDTAMKSSYPPVSSFDKVLLETRFMAIIDIYQALIGRRSYKKSWAPPAAVKFIDQLAGIEHDQAVWEEFVEIMGHYPVGSLVELNDGSLAFVVQRHTQDPLRPKVAVVRNGQSETITHHTLLDLETEPDIKIVKDLDNYDVFGDQSFDVFAAIQVS
jgi:putative nucleotidyltransferase with HDIG domain